MNRKPRYSIVTPIHNESGNILLLYKRLSEVMDSLDEDWELVMINDASHDNSLQLMLQLAQEDERVKVVNFARNFGHQIAVTAGIDYARGEAVILMDADLQDPPEVIPELVERWEAGYEVVYAVRAERKGENRFKLMTSKLFYRIIYRITDVNIPLDTGDFRLMDKRVVQVLRDMREHNRFIRGMTSWVGFKQIGVTYIREARHSGETKYPIRKMIALAWDAVTGFSYFPLQIMIYFSALLGFLAVLTIPVVSLLRITQGPEFFGGQTTTIVLLLMVSSFQLFFLFVMGQYVARIYDETRGRPLYVVASTEGFDHNTLAPHESQGEDENLTQIKT